MKNERISSHPCPSYLIIVLFWEVGETRINVSAILFALAKPIHAFSPGLLTPSARLLPEPLAVFWIKTPRKCLRFHFRGRYERERSERHFKSHLSAHLCRVGWGRGAYKAAHPTSQGARWLGSATSQGCVSLQPLPLVLHSFQSFLPLLLLTSAAPPSLWYPTPSSPPWKPEVLPPQDKPESLWKWFVQDAMEFGECGQSSC